VADEYELSDRELEILEMLASGASNKEIAAQLVISTNTVKVHLRNIYTKLKVNSRTEAAMFALRSNLVTLEGIEANVDVESQASNPFRFLPTLEMDYFGRRSQTQIITIVLVGILLLGILGILIVVLLGGDGAGNTSGAKLESQRWKTLADLPTARTGLAVTTFENQIYTIGGETKDEISDFVERFDPLTNTWERLADKPTPVTDMHALVIGGLIYVPGGRLESGEVTNILEAFDPRSEDWRAMAPLPAPLSAYAAVTFEGKLILFGGWSGEAYTNSVFWYDPQLNVWTEGSEMQIERGYAQAEAAGGAIFIMGGMNQSGSLDLNEAYFPQLENTGETPWQPKASMPEARYAFGLVSVADILHVVGGSGASEELSPLKYFPQTDSWQTFSPATSQSWSHLGLTAIESYLYAMGGKRQDRISADNLSYKAIYTITLPLVE
jgi:DNA-binding CsgD family transcriptional regulator/N-acetylneuraminic acid mutarotase